MWARLVSPRDSEKSGTEEEQVRDGKRDASSRFTVERLFQLVVTAGVDDWLDRTFWELSGRAEARLQKESSDRAQILCAIHNAHAETNKELRTPRHFDFYERAKSKSEAQKFLKENPRSETLSAFINRNQMGMRKQ